MEGNKSPKKNGVGYGGCWPQGEECWRPCSRNCERNRVWVEMVHFHCKTKHFLTLDHNLSKVGQRTIRSERFLTLLAATYQFDLLKGIVPMLIRECAKVAIGPKGRKELERGSKINSMTCIEDDSVENRSALGRSQIGISMSCTISSN